MLSHVGRGRRHRVGSPCVGAASTSSMPSSARSWTGCGHRPRLSRGPPRRDHPFVPWAKECSTGGHDGCTRQSPPRRAAMIDSRLPPAKRPAIAAMPERPVDIGAAAVQGRQGDRLGHPASRDPGSYRLPLRPGRARPRPPGPRTPPRRALVARGARSQRMSLFALG